MLSADVLVRFDSRMGVVCANGLEYEKKSKNPRKANEELEIIINREIARSLFIRCLIFSSLLLSHCSLLFIRIFIVSFFATPGIYLVCAS